MTKWITVLGLLMLLGGLSAIGCGKKSDTADSEKPGVSGIDKDAQDAVLAEIQRHWVKSADGWTTAKMTGTSFAADHFLRQVHDISVDEIHSFDLTESDKMNGFEWSGEVTFKKIPCREAGDPGMVLEGLANVNPDRPRGRWSQWVDYTPERVLVQKQKGQWHVDQDTWLLRGTIPTADDYAKAGVK